MGAIPHLSPEGFPWLSAPGHPRHTVYNPGGQRRPREIPPVGKRGRCWQILEGRMEMAEHIWEQTGHVYDPADGAEHTWWKCSNCEILHHGGPTPVR